MEKVSTKSHRDSEGHFEKLLGTHVTYNNIIVVPLDRLCTLSLEVHVANINFWYND